MILKKMISLKKIIVCILLLCCQSYLSAEIRIFCTAALIDEGFESRKSEYLHCFAILESFGYPDPYVVEAIKINGPTFLDDFSTYVYYSTTNNPSLKNKGVNEGRTMLEALKAFNFDPEDMIVKITGRYHFTSDQFIRMIEDNPDIDGFVKNDGVPYSVITGCFALRYHYILDFLEHLNYGEMEKNMICIEWKLADFLQNIVVEKQAKIHYVNRLHLSAHVWGSPDYRPGTLNW